MVFWTGLSRCVNPVIPVQKFLCSTIPHNPTGVVTDKAFFQEIVKLAKRFKFMVINDFAYGKITYDGYVAPSFLEIEGAKDVGVEFGSFSKSYNMAGWRIGYCVGNEKLSRPLEKSKAILITVSFPPSRWRVLSPSGTVTRPFPNLQNL